MPITGRQFKSAIYDQFSRIGKALAAPRRIELLDLLCQGPRTVEVLAGHAGVSVANASQHLKILKAARLVEADKQGLYVEYRLAGEQVCRFLQRLRELAESRLVEVEHVTRQFFEERGALEQVDRDELLRRVRRGDVTILDVRPPEEYRAGHIPGALSVPLSDLQKRLRELPRNRDVVAYCRGPYCVMAIEAVAVLRRRGFRAYRMADGVVEWRARGGRIATAAAAAERPARSRARRADAGAPPRIVPTEGRRSRPGG